MKKEQYYQPDQRDLMNARLYTFPAAIIGSNIAFTLENPYITLQDMLSSAVRALSVEYLPRKILLATVQEKKQVLLKYAEPYDHRQLWLPDCGIRIVNVSDPFTWTDEKQRHWVDMMEDVQRLAYSNNLHDIFDTLYESLTYFKKRMLANSTRNSSNRPASPSRAVNNREPTIDIELPVQKKWLWSVDDGPSGVDGVTMLESGIDTEGKHYSIIGRREASSYYTYTIFGSHPIDPNDAIGIVSHVPIEQWEPYSDSPFHLANPFDAYKITSLQQNDE